MSAKPTMMDYDTKTPIDEAKLLKDLNKAKIELMMKGSVFLSTILFSMKFSWDTNVPTAGTDGIHLIVNPYFFRSLTIGERVFLLAHEAWHVAFDHMLRGHDLNKEKYNIAADYVINLLLQLESYEVIPGACVDKKFSGMSTEEVYDLLPDPPKGGSGYICDIKRPKSKEEAANIKANVEATLVRARTQSKLSGDKPGSIPGEVEFFIENLINPKLPWNIILQNYMTAYAKSDYSWSKPNRRYISQGMYLPTQFSETLENVAVAVDSSYSVSDDDFTLFISEIEDIRVTHKPEMVTIVDFDTKVKRIHELDQDAEIRKVNFSGRGGTDLYPMFNHFIENPPTVLIVFSDLQCTPIKEETEFPVIWICIGNPNGKVNFGNLIHVEI